MSWIESSEASSLYGLDVDQSHYNVSSRYGEPVYLYSLSSECVKCPFTRLQQINTHASLTIKSAVDYSFRVFDQDQGIYSNATSDNYLCELNRTSGEFGAYHLLIHADGRCAVDTVYEPVNIYFRKPTLIRSFCLPPNPVNSLSPRSLHAALLLFVLILVCLVGALKGWHVASARYWSRRERAAAAAASTSSDGPNPDNEMETPLKVQKKARLKSLDCFRG